MAIGDDAAVEITRVGKWSGRGPRPHRPIAIDRGDLNIVQRGSVELRSAHDIDEAVVGHAGVPEAGRRERSRRIESSRVATARNKRADLHVVEGRRGALAAKDVEKAVVGHAAMREPRRREAARVDPVTHLAAHVERRKLHVIQERTGRIHAANHVDLVVVLRHAGVLEPRRGQAGGRGPGSQCSVGVDRRVAHESRG